MPPAWRRRGHRHRRQAVYRKGFGLANMELPVMLLPMIRMRIHSATKYFACPAYIPLCEEDKAGIDDTLGKYIPEHCATPTMPVLGEDGLRLDIGEAEQFRRARQDVGCTTELFCIAQMMVALGPLSVLGQHS
jgi:hypothetical protein